STALRQKPLDEASERFPAIALPPPCAADVEADLGLRGVGGRKSQREVSDHAIVAAGGDCELKPASGGADASPAHGRNEDVSVQRAERAPGLVARDVGI